MNVITRGQAPASPRLAYGTEAFEQASRFARDFGAQTGRTRDTLTFLSQNFALCCRATVSILRLPRVDVPLSDSESGRSLKVHLLETDSGVPTGRFAQALLATDQPDDLYLSGRRKQALRTNLTHCRNAGITCREVRDVGELSALRSEILKHDDAPEWFTDWDGRWKRVFIARHAEGELAAVANATVDGRWAWLGQFTTVSEQPGAGIARYALHFHMYQLLRDDGVRWLWAGNALNLWPGLQYFQYLLGFEIYNLRPAKSGAVGVDRARDAALDRPKADLLARRTARMATTARAMITASARDWAMAAPSADRHDPVAPAHPERWSES